MKSRKILQSTLFDIAWAIFLTAQLATLSQAYSESQNAAPVTAYKAAMGISCALLAAVIVINLIKKVYPVKTLICYALSGAVFALSWYFCRQSVILWSFLILAAAYRQSGKRVIFISAFLTALDLIVMIAGSQAGIFTDFIFGSGRNRHGLGYLWTTVAPTLLLFFALQYIWLRKEKMRIWEYIIIELANIYLYIKTDTYAVFFGLTAILAFFAVEGAFKRRWRFLGRLKWLYYLGPALICVITVIIYYMYDGGNETWSALNDILKDRLSLGKYCLESFGVTPFGQEIIWSGHSTAALDGAYLYADCSYIQLLVNCGAAFLINVILIYTRLNVRAFKAKDFWLIWIGAAALLLGVLDPRLFDLAFNVIPLLAFLELEEAPLEYEKGFLKKIWA